MFGIIIANFGFWINCLIPIIFGLYLLYTKNEYFLQEFGIQVGATILYVSIIFTLLFSYTTDLADTEYWNGKVTSFEYYEEWTEEVTYTEEQCSGSGNNRTCRTVTKTREDYHSPYWMYITSNGEEQTIDQGAYLNASSKFGSSKIELERSDKVSYNDGDKYISYPNVIIPTAIPHSFTNYVTAAKGNVIHVKVPEQDIKQLEKDKKLVKYPSTYLGFYQESRLDRVIDTTKSISNISVIGENLNIISYKLGFTKQVNPIIYITDEDRSFKDALSQYWSKAKKNDVVLILGIDKSTGIIQWSDCIAWTNNTDFEVDCKNKFQGLKANDPKVLAIFEELIRTEFVRKPMKEFEYLKENITLEWYYQVLIVLGNIALTWFISWKVLNRYSNNSNYGFRRKY